MLRDRMDDLPVGGSGLSRRRGFSPRSSTCSVTMVRSTSRQRARRTSATLIGTWRASCRSRRLPRSENDGADAGAVAERIKAQSEGGFLYVTQVLRGVEWAGSSRTCSTGFPAGSSRSTSLLRAAVSRGARFRGHSPLLDILAAAREPLGSIRSPGSSERTGDGRALLQKVAPFFHAATCIGVPRVRPGSAERRRGRQSNVSSRPRGRPPAHRHGPHDRLRAGTLDRIVLSHLRLHLVEWAPRTAAGGADQSPVLAAVPQRPDGRPGRATNTPSTPSPNSRKNEPWNGTGSGDSPFRARSVAFEGGGIRTMEPPASLALWSDGG